MHTDLIILGAGAAGLFCAAEAGSRGRTVLVLEHQDAAGKKIRISGGGRCNFTNLNAGPEHFVSGNPRFCVSALQRFSAHDFLSLIEEHGITWHEKTAGQLFCDGSAQQIVDMLLTRCIDASVQIRYGCEVHEVTPCEKHHTPDGADTADRPDPSDSLHATGPPIRTPRFMVETSCGRFSAHSVVVATGGLSIPSIGASPVGYRVAESFGLAIVQPRAALVPYTWRETDRELYTVLAGVSCDSIVRVGGAEFHDALLFTHRGLSGPSILQSSLYWQQGAPVIINLLPELDAAALIRDRRTHARDAASLLSGMLPKRLVELWCRLHAPAAHPSQWSSTVIERFASTLNSWEVRPAGTEGYRTAEVTAGGVDTQELSSRTMEARRVPGLYFIGEVVDVTGLLGGFNFQWAWSSAAAAGQIL